MSVVLSLSHTFVDSLEYLTMAIFRLEDFMTGDDDKVGHAIL